jgi:hypothetical protein
MHLTEVKTYNNIKPHIMKKSFLAIGLLSLVMILTSFTTPETTKATVNNTTTVEAAGSGVVGGNFRLDAAGSGVVGGNFRLDAAGSGVVGGNFRLD